MNAILDLVFRSPALIGLDMAWKSALVLAAAVVITLAMRHTAAAARHLVWCLALCSTLALPFMALAVPGRVLAILPPGVDSKLAAAPAVTIPTPALIHVDPRAKNDPRPSTALARRDSTDVLPFPPGRVDSASAALARTFTLSPWVWLLGSWSALAIVLLATPLIGRLSLSRLARGARPVGDGPWATLLHDLTTQLGLARRVTLLQSDHPLMPMTWGCLRPVILLPTEADDWPAAQRRDVLLHELAHIRRYDCLTQAIAQAACALYWFNPLAWMAARRMRIERERACDDIILLTGSRASDYAEHLLDLARSLRSRRSHALTALAMAQTSHLEGRLVAILDATRSRQGPTRLTVSLGLGAAVLIVLLLSVVRIGVRANEVKQEQRAPQALAAPIPKKAKPRAHLDGRVVDSTGKPVPDASLVVLAQKRRQVGDLAGAPGDQVMGTAQADAEGRFQLDFPIMPAALLKGLSVIATATGFGFDGNELKTDAMRQETTVTLDPEKIVEGQLIDIQGQPTAGVTVRVQSLYVRSHGYGPYDSKGDKSLWPAPVTTNPDGRFRLRELSQRAAISLEIDDPRFARQLLKLEAGDDGRTRAKILPLLPAQVINVQVLRDDDGKPMAGAWVHVRAERRNPYSWGESTDARADDQGRARIVPWPGDSFSIWAYPAEGAPYLRRETDLNWPKGATSQSVELKLRQGVVLRGTLTEELSGKPVAGAGISYYQTHRNNPLYLGSFNRDSVSGPDGMFTMVVPHGPGHLLVRGPSADYIHVPTSHGELGTGWMPDLPLYPDALAHLDLKTGAVLHNVALWLRRGVTVQGHVVGPDGSPTVEAFAMGRTYAPYDENRFAFMPFNGGGPQLKVRNGRFEIPGCDLEKPSTFHFLDIKNQLGATVEISGKSAAAGPVTVQLQKCGSARVRVRDADGKSVVNRPADEWPGNLILIITPGADFGATDKTNADMEFQVNLDPERNRNLRTDADGRATFVSLIPGARYRFRSHEFTAEAGKMRDLPDITIPREK